jgi:tRNA threonylcarbamoyladenosine biosynthesis protein TsaE
VVDLTILTRAAMLELGRRLAAATRPGDVFVLTGDLGAGKTTLTQGIGAGLDVRGPITSPTFVIARVHPSLTAGPALVHVDAYRLSSIAEIDDLDLDTSLETSVTVVEWGQGLVEDLSADRLEILIERKPGGSAGPDGDRGPDDDLDEERLVTLTPVGRRWTADWADLAGELKGS